MAKVITLSRQFLQGHPRAGEPTYFVEKVWETLHKTGFQLPLDNSEIDVIGLKSEIENFYSYGHTKKPISSTPKLHTIRGGNRFKDGDMVSLRVWSSKPYHSKQITIAPDIRVGVQAIEITSLQEVIIETNQYCWMDSLRLVTIAQNDGLSLPDFQAWFNKPFSGQIIHFTDYRY